ncbi:MAG: hypothetical protein LCH53_13120 [Bacteroidetes bacterium]|nr:hypothetical protein [Bacteroidota bacterium]
MRYALLSALLLASGCSLLAHGPSKNRSINGEVPVPADIEQPEAFRRLVAMAERERWHIEGYAEASRTFSAYWIRGGIDQMASSSPGYRAEVTLRVLDRRVSFTCEAVIVGNADELMSEACGGMAAQIERALATE